ncbi:MAG: MipA/OmpV family protein [Nitratireductor sp.]
MAFRIFGAALAAGLALTASEAKAEAWWSGDWHLTVGVTVFTAPDYDGARDYLFSASPLISLGRAGGGTRFSSRNDNISLAFIDTGDFRAGATGKVLFGRDSADHPRLVGLSDVRWGGEAGAFAEAYPLDWLRIRGEVRHGIRSHSGVVADLAADAFVDITPAVRLSGGPRLSFATGGYFDAYYGVDAIESAASGLAVYDPDGGLKSAGVGGAVTWKTTEKITTSAFVEYSRLLGPAADSSIVRQGGSADQVLVGASATYRFDFSM